ncbi:hypothetical protein CEXT_665621 [Caerostris extrusa]|uniref:Uncharacterized protein n=1 Tax=Caerostris extrusa TaxID=172846 RepID=A0AAV4XQ25_CAEEX|nr:hypothetical protein CEXT_665621 [Caerostris extrusa]
MLTNHTDHHIIRGVSIASFFYYKDILLPHMSLLTGAVGADLIFKDEEIGPHGSISLTLSLQSCGIFIVEA